MVSNAEGLIMFSTGKETFGCRTTGEVYNLRIWTRVLTEEELLGAYRDAIKPRETKNGTN